MEDREMKQKLKNGFIVEVKDYEEDGYDLEGKLVICYCSDNSVFEEVVCLPEQVKGYIKQWESLDARRLNK